MRQQTTFRDGFISFAEAAAYLGISERNARYKIPKRLTFRVGSRSLVNRAELREWMEQFRAAPEADLDELVDGVVADVLGES